MQYSVEVRNGQVGSIETTVGTAPIARVYGGAAMPVSTATAAAGTVLASMTLPSDWLAAPNSGAVAKAGAWADSSADASGLARYIRFYDSGATTCHIQGLVSQVWVISTAYLLNQHAHNGTNVYICTTAGTSAGSGGPTGTGTGITDGTCVWSYVGAVDFTLDNTNIAAAQSVTLTTCTITAGNA